MLVKELARMVHQNARDHGWWDEHRPIMEVFALICSEWSEALEEAREGNPMAYVDADVRREDQIESVLRKVERGADGRYVYEWKEFGGRKPEGVAIELMDGVIRIMDLMGFLGEDYRVIDDDGQDQTVENLYGKDRSLAEEDMPESVGELVMMLTMYTSMCLIVDGDMPDQDGMSEVDGIRYLLGAASIALSWVKDMGMDPMALLIEKHEYNKGRPYKHGKKF